MIIIKHCFSFYFTNGILKYNLKIFLRCLIDPTKQTNSYVKSQNCMLVNDLLGMLNLDLNTHNYKCIFVKSHIEC